MVTVWNTGSAAARYRLKKNKKIKKRVRAQARKRPSLTRAQAQDIMGEIMKKTIELLKKQHDVLVDVIQYLDSTKQSNTLIRSQVDTILNFEKKLKEDSEKELNA